MNVPDWLWQNIVSDLLADGFKAAAIGLLAWMYRRLNTIRTPPKPTLTAGTQAQILYDVRGLAGTERHILYNVEAVKPSLARRLEDLAAWYLHVS